MTIGTATTGTAGAPLRWGVLGTGGIAKAFVRDLGALDGHRVVAVGSRTAAAGQAFAAEFAVPRSYGSHADLVADPDVDVVYVATPHSAHAQGALLAISAGKHVLVEKAFTLDAVQAQRVVDAARAAGVFCMEAMWTRFLPHVVRLRERLADGAIGEVRTVVADHGQRFTPDPAHRLFDPALGGGALLDLGVYPISWAHMVLGAPSGIVATSVPAVTGVDAQTSAVLTYPGGAHALVTCTMESFTPRRAWIAGTLGTIDVEPTFYAPSRFTLRRDDGHVETFDPDVDAAGLPLLAGPGKGLRFEAAEVARCVAAGLTESPGMPLDETVAVMATMDEIRRQIGLVHPVDHS
jgi:predicted dehydrogenase